MRLRTTGLCALFTLSLLLFAGCGDSDGDDNGQGASPTEACNDFQNAAISTIARCNNITEDEARDALRARGELLDCGSAVRVEDTDTLYDTCVSFWENRSCNGSTELPTACEGILVFD